MAVDAGVNGINQRYIPWIFAEADESWEERRKRNPKRLGELSQAAFLLKAEFGIWPGGALGRQ